MHRVSLSQPWALHAESWPWSQIAVVLAVVISALGLGRLGGQDPAAALAVGLAAICLVITVRNVQAGLILLLALMPFTSLLKRLQYLVLPIPAVRFENNPIAIVPDLILLALLLHVALNTLLNKGGESSAQHPTGKYGLTALDWLAMAIIGLSLLQVLNPLNSILNGVYGLRGSGYWYIAAYFVGRVLLDQPALRRKVLWTIVITGAIVAGYGLKQYYLGLFEFEEVWLREGAENATAMFLGGKIRFFSTMNHTSSVGGFLVVTTVWTATLLLIARRHRLLLTLLLTIQLFGIIIGQGKSAIIAVFAGLGVFAALRLGRSSVGRFLILALLMIAGLLLGPDTLDVAGEASGDEVLAITLSWVSDPLNAPTFQNRINGLQIFLDLAIAWPLGAGPGSGYRLDYLTRARLPSGQRVWAPEIQLTIWASELGVLGVLLFLLLLLAAGVSATKVLHNAGNQESRQLAIGLGAIVTCAAVFTVSGAFWSSREAATLFWLSLGMLTSLKAQLSRAREDQRLAQQPADELATDQARA